MKQVKFSIRKAGAFYRKPTIDMMCESVAKMSYNGNTGYYDTQHGVMPSCIRVFFLWFYLNIDTPFVMTGYGKGTYKDVTDDVMRQEYTKQVKPR